MMELLSDAPTVLDVDPLNTIATDSEEENKCGVETEAERLKTDKHNTLLFIWNSSDDQSERKLTRTAKWNHLLVSAQLAFESTWARLIL